jgi:adenylate cyclase
MLANAAVVREDDGMDFAAHGLLDDLDGDERAQRLALLTRLAQDGFSLQELTRAVGENRLALLPVDRVFGGTCSAREIEEQTGLAAATMMRIRQMQGLPAAGPDDLVFSAEDVEAARATRLFLEAGFDEERIIEVTSVLGQGMARLAATITAATGRTFLHKGDSEDDVARRFAEVAEQLAPAVRPILAAAFTAHLRDAVARGVLGRAEIDAGDLAGAQEMAVGFADVVGFTRLGSEVEVAELGTVAGRLGQLSVSLVHAPVRLIKTIGDAAMFVSPDAAPLVAVLLELVAAFDAEQLPSLRAGVAYGPALARAGDYFGHPVNLASRVTGVARPGSVLCTREVRDAAEGLDWSVAGRFRLKGVSGLTRLYRARSREEDRDGDGDGGSPAPD